jgi:hypothetical protein
LASIAAGLVTLFVVRFALNGVDATVAGLLAAAAAFTVALVAGPAVPVRQET